MSKMKISLLTNMVTPYRVPFFKAMALDKQVKNFRVLTCVERERDRDWSIDNANDYKLKRLLGITLNFKVGKDARRIMHFRFGILWELLKHRPDKLIIGDASWTSFIAVFACKLLCIPYVVWNEITTTSKVSQGAVAKLRHYMYKNSSHIIASCQMAKEYLFQCGIDHDKISIVNNAVNNELFLKYKSELQPLRSQLRADLGIAKDAQCFLYVGQLISRKRVIETLKLLIKVNKYKKIHFIVAGTGPLEDEMKKIATEKCFTNITFCGFVQDKSLSEVYVACDSLILLSEDEPWGMVVNEALIFDCSVFATIEVAAAMELSSCFPISTARYDDNIIDNLLAFISSSKVKPSSNRFISKNSPQNMASLFVKVLE